MASSVARSVSGPRCQAGMGATSSTVARIGEHLANLDELGAESEMLCRLAAVRAAVNDLVNGAEDVPSVRAAILQVFENVLVLPVDEFAYLAGVGPEHEGVPDLTKLMLLPVVREDMVVDPASAQLPLGVDELHRVPVALDSNKERGSGVPE